MKLDEANFILSQLSLAHPCINGYMCITGDQIDEAVEVINTELKSKDNIIEQLKEEIILLKTNGKLSKVVRYDKKMKQYFNTTRGQFVVN